MQPTAMLLKPMGGGRRTPKEGNYDYLRCTLDRLDKREGQSSD